MSECTCWVKYPNESHKHKSGKWKCVDNYECIRDLETIPLKGLPFPKYLCKTKCIMKGAQDMTINKSITVSLTTEEMAFIKWLADRDKVNVARELRQIFYTELGELIDLYDEERQQESEAVK